MRTRTEAPPGATHPHGAAEAVRGPRAPPGVDG